jgi:hypothetical protein
MLPPAVLKHVGDIEHIAALAAPAKLHLLQPTDGQGQPLSATSLPSAFSATRTIYQSANHANQLKITPP